MPTSATAPAHSPVALQESAILISRILRDAKVDAPLRPKAFAAILVAAARGALPTEPGDSLAVINREVAAALAESDLSGEQQKKLAAALRLAGPDFEQLPEFIAPIADVLEKHNLPGVLHRNVDLLGICYEAFLRYGFDNNALGIVFTPRHITRFCVELIGVGPKDRVIDIACGTGGFLVAAHDAMCKATPSTETPRHRDEQVIAGFDTNPTVWAMASLNMVFRGDSSASIQLGNCFGPQSRTSVRRQFTRAFLNPPFSQNAEPERDFIDATMEALAPGGRCAVVVKAGIFADDDNAQWRAEFTRRHTVLGMISLPDDVFYPTSAPSSILLAEAHIPQPDREPVLMAHVWNDGFEKLKNKRVPRPGSELQEVNSCFQAMLAGKRFNSRLAGTVSGKALRDGAEWSPQEWLPQPAAAAEEIRRGQREVASSILRAVAQLPELADAVLEDLNRSWRKLPPSPVGQQGMVRDFFTVVNGKSAGEKRYSDGTIPYISSGDATNSIVRLVEPEPEEMFADGGITVTAFGQAAVQPWPFVARGNGGSAVRVLIPRFNMSVSELTWFAAQINAQRWRFFYARMAIQSRIERLMLNSPPSRLPEPSTSVARRVREFRRALVELSEF